MDDFFSTSSK